MSDFFRFPHTPHVTWLGPGQPRDDKVLAPAEVEALLADEVVVEEKVDGANLGFSTSEDGELLAQHRGRYVAADERQPQFRALVPWLASRREALAEALGPGLVLFGEWCLAVHCVRYDRLPDWFLGFDVYDRAAGAFWDTGRRDALLAQVGLRPVPRLARGHHTLESLTGLLGASRVGSDLMEGIVARREEGGLILARGKLVRAEFTQAIGEHWTRRPLERNRLAAGATAWP